MNEAKFTKGEWHVSDYSGIDGSIRVMVGNIVISYNGHIDNSTIANAHLIAAAPKMYDLLERLTSHDNCKKDIIHLLGEADRLLAEARGD